jgi:ABC-type amino acid transport substrate-binding protein
MYPKSLQLLFIICVSVTLAQATFADALLDRVREAGKIRVTYPAESYPLAFDTAGEAEPSGYIIDLCLAAVSEVAKAVDIRDLPIVWMKGNTPERLSKIRSGAAELDCGTTTITLGRSRDLDFSSVTFAETGTVMVSKNSRIFRLADLQDRRVAIIPDTTTSERLAKRLGDWGMSFSEVPIQSIKEGFEKLQKKEVDAVAGDSLMLTHGLPNRSWSQSARLISEPFSMEPYGFSMQRGSPDFRLAVNRGIATKFRSEDPEALIAKWFGVDTEPSQLMHAIFSIFGFAE